MSNFLTLLGTPTPTTIALRLPGTTRSYSDQDDDTSVSRIWDHDFLRCNKKPDALHFNSNLAWHVRLRQATFLI